ncbi:hypothetical protein F2Q69_00004952 [Brassica cretica]|uniref:Uncharacterized protein n=1 Tax=Brassica cretica TaxID=69181 RepID=A0A8S9P4T9_BRACR|nr:hypothetical protein F2Q69_00004952 [Brassica cretica]
MLLLVLIACFIWLSVRFCLSVALLDGDRAVSRWLSSTGTAPSVESLSIFICFWLLILCFVSVFLSCDGWIKSVLICSVEREMRKLHRTKDYKCNTVLVLCLVLLYQQNDMLHVVLFHVSSSCALCLDSLATLLSRPVLSCFGSIGVGICTLLSHKFWEHPCRHLYSLVTCLVF